MNFLAAIGFLTSIPIGRRTMEGRSLAGSAVYFPLVGLLIGLILASVDYGLGRVLPNLLTSAITITILVLITGALHFEGFVDACDGLFGGHTRERRLEIMRMKNVGAYAVAGGALLLILKFAAISSLSHEWDRFWIIVIFPMLSRWGMTLALSVFPYAREQGLGTAFRGVETALVIIAAAVTLIIAGVFAGLAGALLFALATIVAIVMGLWVTKLLGGLTGDIYGAINELSEVVLLVTAIGIMHYMSIEPIWKVFS
ncbi:MAG: adenosylcobinamide-GDP ribazoletransferase [Dehalococcoidia bacterium]|jgi:adenosylcobinamide-GDP ribazoletransferase